MEGFWAFFLLAAALTGVHSAPYSNEEEVMDLLLATKEKLADMQRYIDTPPFSPSPFLPLRESNADLQSFLDTVLPIVTTLLSKGTGDAGTGTDATDSDGTDSDENTGTDRLELFTGLSKMLIPLFNRGGNQRGSEVKAELQRLLDSRDLTDADTQNLFNTVLPILTTLLSGGTGGGAGDGDSGTNGLQTFLGLIRNLLPLLSGGNTDGDQSFLTRLFGGAGSDQEVKAELQRLLDSRDLTDADTQNLFNTVLPILTTLLSGGTGGGAGDRDSGTNGLQTFLGLIRNLLSGGNTDGDTSFLTRLFGGAGSDQEVKAELQRLLDSRDLTDADTQNLFNTVLPILTTLLSGGTGGGAGDGDSGTNGLQTFLGLIRNLLPLLSGGNTDGDQSFLTRLFGGAGSDQEVKAELQRLLDSRDLTDADTQNLFNTVLPILTTLLSGGTGGGAGDGDSGTNGLQTFLGLIRNLLPLLSGGNTDGDQSFLTRLFGGAGSDDAELQRFEYLDSRDLTAAEAQGLYDFLKTTLSNGGSKKRERR